MASSPSSSPAPIETKPENSESEKPSLQSNQPDPFVLPPPPVTSSSSSPSAYSVTTDNPNSNSSILATPQPPLIQSSFTPSTISPGTLPPTAPSFRPVTQMMTMSTPHFSPLPNPNMQNPNFQNPNVQPPGVNPVSIMIPGVPTGAGAVSVSVSPLRPGGMYQPPPGQPLHPSARPYGQIPNGYAMPPPAPQGTIPPPVS